jgi:hypothetical protein
MGRLGNRLGKKECAEESLIMHALAASSTDHPLLESVHNTLSPIARSQNLVCYWSSSGSMVSGFRVGGT